MTMTMMLMVVLVDVDDDNDDDDDVDDDDDNDDNDDMLYTHFQDCLKIFQEDFSTQMPSTHLYINILRAQFEGIATCESFPSQEIH